MQPIFEEVVNLSMWSVGVGTVGLCAGLKLGQKLQRWVNGDVIDNMEQAFEDGKQFQLDELFRTSTTEDPQFCGPCNDPGADCHYHGWESPSIRAEKLFQATRNLKL